MKEPARQSNGRHVVAGNCYSPPQSITQEHFHPNTRHTTCPWKRDAGSYNSVAQGKIHKDPAWYDPSPKEAAKHSTGYVAFWKGVQANDC
ncbi:MAG: DUF427 domain-containing protein [Nitrospiraceae bacterium]